MIPPKEFVQILKNTGFKNFTGVPCSFFQSAINVIIDDKDLRYTIVPNEGSALALASGHYLADAPAVVMIQNSGVGNLVNPLTSLNQIYHIPSLIFISGRAYGIEDEPQHEIMGKSMNRLLDDLGITWKDLPADAAEFETALAEAKEYMSKKQEPYVFFVCKGTVGSYQPGPKKNACPMKRIEAIGLIADQLKGNEYVLATTGKPSRELFAVKDRCRNFYMQGSMGHISALALGMALSRQEEKFVILDGDGALLMHAGILSTIGHYQPENIVHLVLDNESYETTGDQDTTSSTTDFEAMARACGYRKASTVRSAEDLNTRLSEYMNEKGPVFLRIKINREATEDIPRITKKYKAPEITEQIRKEITAVPK